MTWFYCKASSEGECQRTLELRTSAPGGGSLSVRAIAYDDQGKGLPADGRRGPPGRPDRDGRRPGARLVHRSRPGRYGIRATRAGDIRTYPQRVTVR